MLKKLNITLLLFITAISLNAQIKTPQPSPSAKVEQVVGMTNVTLEYSRPAMRGREIYGNLVPFGKVWRTGANANTKITFSDNITIDGKELEKGTYALYTIPNKDSWEVIFYNDAKNWGTPQKWDETKVALKTTVPTHNMGYKMESFTISIGHLTHNSAVLDILWEDTAVGVKFNVPTDKIASESIQKVMAGPSANDYFSAASYYHETGKDLKKALKWIEKAVEIRGDDAFWYLRRMSLIQAELGNKKDAIATAKRSLASAKKAGNADYVKMNKESIAEWSN